MPYLKRKARDLVRELVEDRFWAVPSTTRLQDKIVLVDVGASAGIQTKWLRYKKCIVPVLFEPNPDEAAKLSKTLSSFGDYRVLSHGLSDRSEVRDLYVGEWYGCTSVLKPNMDFLKDYGIAGSYRTKKVETVQCCRYDQLAADGIAPPPDVIKIDIEGFESAALDGFGTQLADVLGIETEAWFYQAYQGQALLHDLIAQLGAFGLRLRRIEEVPAFDGDWVCVNAFFLRSRQQANSLSASQQAKLDVVSRVFRAAPV